MFVLLLTASASAAPYLTPPGPREITDDIYHLEEENVKGRLEALYSGELGHDIVKHTCLQAYVEDIAKRLQNTAIQYRPNFKIEPVIVSAPDFNAYVVGGSRVFLHIGALSELCNEDELAALIGHEAGHNFHHHVGRKMRSLKGARAFALVSGTGSTTLLMHLEFSRETEAEADAFGLHIAALSGFNPYEGRRLFAHLMRLNPQPNLSRLQIAYATHPPSSWRYDKSLQIIKSFLSNEDHLAWGIQNTLSRGYPQDALFLIRHLPSASPLRHNEVPLMEHVEIISQRLDSSAPLHLQTLEALQLPQRRKSSKETLEIAWTGRLNAGAVEDDIPVYLELMQGYVFLRSSEEVLAEHVHIFGDEVSKLVRERIETLSKVWGHWMDIASRFSEGESIQLSSLYEFNEMILGITSTTYAAVLEDMVKRLSQLDPVFLKDYTERKFGHLAIPESCTNLIFEPTANHAASLEDAILQKLAYGDFLRYFAPDFGY